MALIKEALKKFLAAHSPQSTLWIAYSGGVDSHVLLHALAESKSQNSGLDIRVVHINHGISMNADVWQQHCQKICQTLNVQLEVFSIAAGKKFNKNLEAQARAARYEIFGQLLKPGDFLLTAHHQDDQAETLLLHLFRGAGVKGLAAMPMIKIFQLGFLARPLLSVPRAEIINYANQQQLKWIEDESNSDTAFSRNLLRQEVITLLK